MAADSRFDRSLSAFQAGFNRMAARIAGLSFWQFVLLAIILLVAAGISQSLWEKPTNRHIKVLQERAKTSTDKRAAKARGKESVTAEIHIDEDGIVIRRKPAAAETAAPEGKTVPAPPAAADQPAADAAAKDAVAQTPATPAKELGQGEKETSIGKDLHLSDIPLSDADLEEIENIAVKSKSREPQIVIFTLLLILALFVMRMFARAQQRAEQKAEAAEAVAERETLQRQVMEARLQLLQAQVEPHFLFNTLAAVEHLIETAPARAAQMQRHLIEYLRSALPRMRQQSATLGQEVELCASYLKIMQMRMEERLQFDVIVPSGLASASFPPMMIQSLVENAIQHGLEPKPDGGSVHLRAEVRDGKLCVTVEDTGMGFSTDAKAGIGLANIRERLHQLFGANASLTMEPNQPSGTRAKIDVPYAVA